MPSHLRIPAAKGKAKGAEESQVSASSEGRAQFHLGHWLSKVLHCGALRPLKNDLDFDGP